MGSRGVRDVGSRIRKLRLDKGLTQAELGQPELSDAYISLIEAGKRQPSQTALAIIARRLGGSVDELLTGRPPGLEVELELAIDSARKDVDDGDPAAAEESLNQVISQAQRYRLVRIEARAEEVRGALAERMQGPEAALARYERAEQLWRQEPPHHRFLTVAGIARCTDQLGNPQLAIHMLESYLRELETSGKSDPVALMHTYTAMIYPSFAAGLPQKAVEASHAALKFEGHVADPNELARMYLAVARSLLYDGEYGDALGAIRKAEEIYISGGWRNRLAKAHIAEAIVLSRKEDYASARSKLEDALALLEQSPNRLDEALTLNELGHVLRHLDEGENAIKYLERAKPLLEDSDVIEMAFNERELGLCLTDHDPKRAEEHLKRAVDLYRMCGATGELATTFRALGNFYVNRGKKDLAIDALSEGLAVIEERPA